MKRISLFGAAAVLAAALAGCGGNPDPIWAQAFGMRCGAAGTSGICKTAAPGTGEAVVSRYCYATIGRTNCFDRPDPHSNNEPLGSSGY